MFSGDREIPTGGSTVPVGNSAKASFPTGTVDPPVGISLWIRINTLQGLSAYMQRKRELGRILVPVRNSFPEAVYCLCTHNTVFKVVPVYDSFWEE